MLERSEIPRVAVTWRRDVEEIVLPDWPARQTLGYILDSDASTESVGEQYRIQSTVASVMVHAHVNDVN